MVDTILNIANKALQRLRFKPLSATEYNTKQEALESQLRAVVQHAYDRIVSYKTEEFKFYLDVNTTAGANEYALSLPTENLADLTAWLITPGDNDGKPINYYPEKHILSQYNGDLSNIEEGEPYGWFFRTTTDNTIKRRSFVLAPDDVYTIRFYYYNIPSNIDADTVTPFNRQGDRLLEQWILNRIADMDESYLSGRATREMEFDELESRYLSEPRNINTRVWHASPYQHGGGAYGGSPRADRSGGVWF